MKNVNFFTLLRGLSLANYLELLQYFAATQIGMLLDIIALKRFQIPAWCRPSQSSGFSGQVFNNQTGDNEMKHFAISLACVFVGVLTGLLLSETVISQFLPGTETLLAKNGLVVLSSH